MERPNVLFIITDQQHHETIRAAGHSHMNTPNLDKLAEEGVLCTHAYCNSPVCMPSRQSLFSGQYPSSLNLTANGQELPENVPLIHQVLQPYGYEAAQIGKLHFKNAKTRDRGEQHPRYGFDHLLLSETPVPGFCDDYDMWVEQRSPGSSELCRELGEPQWDVPGFADRNAGMNPYVFQGPDELTHTRFVAEETCDFIRDKQEEQWFAIAGIFAPHDPVNPPQRFVDIYDPATLPNPAMTEKERETLGLTDEQWRYSNAYYDALVSHIDEEVGRMLDCLEETGQKDNTLVIFTSDHGDNTGNHGRGGKGGPGYDSCARVPLIFRYPNRIPGGRISNDLVELVDLAPTIAEFCGVVIPPFFQGLSLVPLLEDKAYEPRESVFLEIGNPNGKQWKTVRTDNYKLCVSNEGDEELYDMANDPDELQNRSADPEMAQTLLQMHRVLVQRIFEARPHVPRHVSCW